ncbi:sel1 repeat family protein [Vibrio nigripulchritudo]|uniref:Putative TPR repeat, SEL1 subfamily protein n=1 Tax=Vibrio nigripulchritudo TaxID=28173 RepID=U4KDE8_9VIBR|nr:sel1 repeat family protein [Vibrio nigripulchritudo]CCO60993.1 putative TPR repeat, SEL1 subfamily protein [Vibrio nigripulchritudo]
MKSFIALILVILISACSESNPNVTSKQKGDTADALVQVQLYKEANSLYEVGDVLGAVTKLELAVEMGDIHSKELLGFLLLREPEVTNINRGFALVTKAAESGLASAQFYLGSCLYDDGCGIPENKTLSAYWLARAKQGGESGADMLLGFLQEELDSLHISDSQYQSARDSYQKQLN